MMAFRAAAQDRGVAGFQRKRTGVGRHVRAAFVNDADRAERHAHALEPETVGSRPLGEHGADGIGKFGDFFKPGRYTGDALLVEQQPVDEGGRAAGGFRSLDVFGVGGKNFRRRRAQRFRRRDERCILLDPPLQWRGDGWRPWPLPRCRASAWRYRRRCAPVCSSQFPRQRHVVPVNERRATFKTEDGGDLARTLAHDTPGVVRRIGNKAAAEFPSVRRPDDDGIAAVERALDRG